MLKLISWNVNGRRGKLAAQVDALAERHADIVALQEVTASSLIAFKEALPAIGYGHLASSFELAPDRSVLRGPRRYGLLLASRLPFAAHDPKAFRVPWPERVLSATLLLPACSVEIHTTHIPPGSSNGWRKIETLEGIYEALAQPCALPRILCGDFNLPQHETETGEVVTWASRQTRTGYSMTGAMGERWDAGERNVILGLAEHGLIDVFRFLHGYSKVSYSWYLRRKGKERGRRFDHVLAARELNPSTCEFLESMRTAGLSDHAPIEVQFDIPSARVTVAPRASRP